MQRQYQSKQQNTILNKNSTPATKPLLALACSCCCAKSPFSEWISVGGVPPFGTFLVKVTLSLLPQCKSSNIWGKFCSPSQLLQMEAQIISCSIKLNPTTWCKYSFKVVLESLNSLEYSVFLQKKGQTQVLQTDRDLN